MSQMENKLLWMNVRTMVDRRTHIALDEIILARKKKGKCCTKQDVLREAIQDFVAKNTPKSVNTVK